MADYDPKDVPILDDVIESADHEKKDPVLSVGSAEPLDTVSDAGFSATENELELFASKAIDLATEDAAETIESALVDYKAVDKAGTSTIDVPAIDRPVTDKQKENQLPKAKQQTSTTNSLLSITDDIVKQLMPKLELHLRLLLRQALKENLPKKSSQTKTSSPSKTDS